MSIDLKDAYFQRQIVLGVRAYSTSGMSSSWNYWLYFFLFRYANFNV